MSLTAMGVAITHLNAFTLDEDLDVSSIDNHGMVVMSSICCPREFRNITNTEGLNSSSGPYNAMVWGGGSRDAPKRGDAQSVQKARDGHHRRHHQTNC